MTAEKKLLRENFHSASWNEPFIMDMGTTGERGVLPPALEREISESVGDITRRVPSGMLRSDPPKLPEVAQPQVLRHYLRLSEETLSTDTCIDFGLGTCTMKYSPKVNEAIVRSPQMADIHPLQDDDTVQGILEVLYKFSETLREISGMDVFSLNGAGGGQAVYTNARILRAYQESRGLGVDKKDEIITTMFSHPCNAATPAIVGYKIITLYADDNGYPDLDSLKAAVSERTAGMIITNPEDTGIYNPRIREWTDTVHAVGGVCVYDQANANGVMGMARAREAGFDLSHFNIHKTFSAPHGSLGPGGGVSCAKKEFAEFLPVPTIEFDGGRYYLNYDMPNSIGKVRSFLGNVQVMLRAYAWVMSLGADGLTKVGETAVLNCNYLQKKLLSRVRGLSKPYAEGKYRLDEIRYSWGKLKEDTGIGTEDVKRRIVDFGVTSYFASHEPWIVPEPFTPEPTETYSRADLDEYVEIFERVSHEAYTDPKIILTAPHQSCIAQADEHAMQDLDKVATTLRVMRRKGL